MEYVSLEKKNITRIGIRDENGNDTGNYLEFDFEDIELPLRYQECIEQHKRNLNKLKREMVIIEKKEDKKGKKLLSSNTEKSLEVLKEYYEEEMRTMDLFLGDGGCAKLLNGRKPYYSMFNDINEMLKPVLPLLQKSAETVRDRIAEKYSMEKEDNILE